MNTLKLLGLSFGVLLNNAVMAAGFQLQTIPDPDDKPLEVGIWYPSDAAIPDQPNTPFQQAVARDANIAGTKLPLLIISHGYGGWMGGHASLAQTLADAGFVVVAPTHTGNNEEDESYPASRWVIDRPRHVSRVIDYMHQQWAQRAALNTDKTAAYGFSAGGYTVMSLAGAGLNIPKLTAFCATHPKEEVCKMSLDKEIQDSELASTGLDIKGADSRIKAVVAVAPAFGFALTADSLQSIKVPMQIWAGELDENVPYDTNIVPMMASLKNSPDLHQVTNAGHYAFRSPCKPELETANPKIWSRVCVDKAGFDRAAFHNGHNAAVLTFLRGVFK